MSSSNYTCRLRFAVIVTSVWTRVLAVIVSRTPASALPKSLSVVVIGDHDCPQWNLSAVSDFGPHPDKPDWLNGARIVVNGR